MKKLRFLFIMICILALGTNLCYASDYISEFYGEKNQTEFEFAVLTDGNYSVAVKTENTVTAIKLDGTQRTFDTSADGYTLSAEIGEGIHSLSFETADEIFFADEIRVSEIKNNKEYFIYAYETPASNDFSTVGARDEMTVGGNIANVYNFDDKTKDLNGKSVSFNFSVEDDGLYSVVSYIGRDDNRYTSANTTYIDGVRLELESATTDDIVGDTTYIRKKTFSNINLSAGEHTMRIDAVMRNNNTDFSLKYVMTKFEYLGSGNSEDKKGLAEIKIQAESYNAISQDILNAEGKTINPVASVATAEGEAVVRVNTTVAPDNGGYSFSYDLDVPKTGVYSFFIHGGTSTSRYISPYEYSINDGEFVSVSESFTRYKNSEVEGYTDLAGHHYHMDGVRLEKGKQKLTIRCSKVRTSDSSTYYIFLDSITFVEAGVSIPDIENIEYGAEVQIAVDSALPGRERGDLSGMTAEYRNTDTEAVSIKDSVMTVNGGGAAAISAKISDGTKVYEAAFNVNTTINNIGVCETKQLSDGSVCAVIKNYGQDKKGFCCVKIQREADGSVRSIELKDYTLSAGGTVLAAIQNADGATCEMFLITSSTNYAPVSAYLNK